MTASTVPLRFKDLNTRERQKRLNRVNVSVLEYGEEISSRDLTSPGELEDFLEEVKKSKEPTGRLLVVQDLSTCM
jgi:hypothetical protein